MTCQLPAPLADPAVRAAVADALTTWFAADARPLPWRETRDPWRILVSEFMLQQTQVDRVWPRYLAWIDRWPTPAALAASPPAEALRAWDRLGYPRRALWLHRAATEITDRFGGRVPDDPAVLETLTGIGPYTARAVSAFAYGHRHPVVDTNTRRVLARAVHGLAAAGAPSRHDLCDQEALLPAEPTRARDVNAATMELGAVVCTARAPRCADCPVAAWCQWRGAGYPYNAPPKRARQARFAGSDREARGKVLQLLRASVGPVGVDGVRAAASDDPAQAERAVDSLVRDGLAVWTADGALTLPPGTPAAE